VAPDAPRAAARPDTLLDRRGTSRLALEPRDDAANPPAPGPLGDASRRLQALAALSGALTDPLSGVEAAQVVADAGLATLGASSASVATLGTFPPERGADGAVPPADTIHLVHSYGLAPEAVAAWRQFPANAPVPLAEVVRTGRPVFLGSRAALYEAYPVLRAAVEGGRSHAFAAVPVWGNGHLRGAFGLTWTDEQPFDADTRAFVETLGTMCAQAILRAHLAEAERGAAARYRSLVEATSQIVWTASADGHFVGPQPAWAAFTGQSLSAYQGNGSADMLHPDDRVRVLEAWGRAVARRAPFAVIARVRRVDGAWRHMRIRGVPMLDAAGRVTEWVGVNADVTAEVEAEAAERAARRAAEEARAAAEAARRAAEDANRTKAEFLATMSHELRTPLTAVVGYTELLSDEIVGPVTPLQREHLARVKASSEHLLILIEDLLAFARIEAGKEQVRREPVDVAAVVEDACSIVAPLAAKRGLPVRVEAPAPGALVLESDAHKVRQVLVNLLANAVKFTERGAVTLTVAAGAEDVTFTVSDTGPGIPAEHQDHIFDAFWQVDQRLTRRVGGTGLGLAVARQLARFLGGDVILAESTIGVGSRFVAVVPASAPAAAGEDPESMRG
jgi:PAS domain S-box-containing protein